MQRDQPLSALDLTFRGLPGAFLILDPSLRIVDVTDAYLLGPGVSRESVVGRDVFEVFPDNPDDDQADGVRNLRASLQHVLDHRVEDVMPAQRYDVQTPSGEFEQRWWQASNSPVLDESGALVAVLHSVQEVTAAIAAAAVGEREAPTAVREDTGLLADRRALAAAHRQVKEAERRFRQLLEAAPDAMVIADMAGVITLVNAQAEQLFGWSRDQLVGQQVEVLIPAPLHEVHVKHRGSYGPGHAPRPMGSGLELRAQRADGSLLPVEVSLSFVETADGPLVSAAVRDVTARTEAERALRESEERFRLTLQHSPIGMAQVGLDGRFLTVNEALCELVGYPEDDLLLMTFQDITYADDLKSDLDLLAQLADGLRSHYQLDKRYRTADGRLIWANLNVTLVRDATGAPLHFVSQIVDVTERRAQSEALLRSSRMDALTGLSNRAALIDALRAAVSGGGASGPALLLLDVDRFKAINDAKGHRAGDALLAQLGATLRSEARDHDVVARFGGDEFAVMGTELTVDGARALGERIVKPSRSRSSLCPPSTARSSRCP